MPPLPVAEPSQASKRVNDLLANSRAEHARHIQNLARTARHAPPLTSYAPTLPFPVPSPNAHALPTPAPTPTRTPSPPNPNPNSSLRPRRRPKNPAGPPPPPSWVHPSSAGSGSGSLAPSIDLLSPAPEAVRLRSSLLAFALPLLPSSCPSTTVPSLVDYALLSLLTPFATRTIPHLPAHLRTRLVRLAAVHRPLSATELELCWGAGNLGGAGEGDGEGDGDGDGNAEGGDEGEYAGTGGEAIVVGRAAYPALKALLTRLQHPYPLPGPPSQPRASPSQGPHPSHADRPPLPPPPDTWDTPLAHLSLPPPPPPLTALVLLCTPLPLALLPRTLATLALLRCTFDPVRTARGLARQVPLLEWLQVEVRAGEGVRGEWAEGLEWGRWAGLRGVRMGFGVGEEGEGEGERADDGWKERLRRRVGRGREGRVELWLD